MMVAKSVDLPTPERPTIAMFSPADKLKLEIGKQCSARNRTRQIFHFNRYVISSFHNAAAQALRTHKPKYREKHQQREDNWRVGFCEQETDRRRGAPQADAEYGG